MTSNDQPDTIRSDSSTLGTHLNDWPLRNMSQKRKMDFDTDHPQALTQKSVKFHQGCDATTHSNPTEQTPVIPKDRAREDSATVHALTSYPSFKEMGSEETCPFPGAKGKGKAPAIDNDQPVRSEETAPFTGAKGKGKAPVRDYDQPNDNSTKDATNSTISGPGPVRWEDLASYKSTSLEDENEPRGTVSEDEPRGTVSEDEPKGTVSGITEHIGDLFAAPDNTVLVHACNTQGSWGGGIALEFRKRYPKAFELYAQHCLVEYHPKKNPVETGSCLLIPPSEEKLGAPKHWIACLFTSARYGRNKDSPDKILAATAPAIRSLLNRLHGVRVSSNLPTITEIRMCQINAGLFSVKWEDTKQVLEEVLAASTDSPMIHVYSLPAPTSTPLRKGQTTLQSFVRRR